MDITMYNRAPQIEKISDGSLVWDMIVIGGGATGLGMQWMPLPADIKHCYWSNRILQKAHPAEAPNSFMAVSGTSPREMSDW